MCVWFFVWLFIFLYVIQLFSFFESACCFLLKQSKPDLDPVHASPCILPYGVYFPHFSLRLTVEVNSAPHIPIILALAPGTSTRDDIIKKSQNLSLTAVDTEATEAAKESMADLHHILDCAVHQKI